ncbi:uncharacterized protein [Spinacia oleracea]|uniref:Pollen Ole e 1 allergen and extensin family protein n=1 Tax=Spinacia oleracea TaxID=3562 RepID=A0A9R0J9U1_SPIOL|nr:uncharacterized protein LOC110801592 [Spinacia oleracea]
MAYSQIFLASVLVVAFLGIAFADDQVDGVSVNPDTKVQGTIFCVKNEKWIPLKGARAVVICEQIAFKSTVTDENGYYLVVLPSDRVSDDCKVFQLHGKFRRPRCAFPTNINNGTTGASLVESEHANLYSVAPIVYKPRPSLT